MRNDRTQEKTPQTRFFTIGDRAINVLCIETSQQQRDSVDIFIALPCAWIARRRGCELYHFGRSAHTLAPEADS